MTDEERQSIAELLPRLLDREWRLDNLYLILDIDGKTVPFKARKEQLEFRRHRHTRNFVPKARKLGISTEIMMENGDEAIFTDNLQVGIIDLKDEDAVAKLDIFRFCWVNGPTYDWQDWRIGVLWRAIHEMNPLTKDNDHAMEWTNGASITASTSFTGRTPQRLHWSEAGPMSAQRPDQAAKIRRGSINSAGPRSIVDIETTMEGPRVGVAYEICELARLSYGKQDLSIADWRIHFFPWMGHPDYRVPGGKPVLAETRAYFQGLQEMHGIVVSEDQQAWYEAKSREQKKEMNQQFPSTLEEALSFAGERPRFDKRGLAWMEQRLKDWAREGAVNFGTLEVQGVGDRPVFYPTDEDSSWFRLWEKPMAGFKYIIGGDFCDAEYDKLNEDLDKHAVPIVRAPARDARTGAILKARVVGAIRIDDRTGLDILARRISLMAAFYGHAMVIVEVNKHMGYVTQLREAGVRNIWHRVENIDNPGRGEGRTIRVAGWKTTPSTKPILIEKLAAAIREEEIEVFCPRILAELRTFQQNNEALPGQHDDWVIGLALAVYAMDSAVMYQEHVPVVTLPGWGAMPPMVTPLPGNAGGLPMGLNPWPVTMPSTGVGGMGRPGFQE